ncbi:MAG: type II toxin-antitoxin system RatA family toxin [Gammaproteobacteria bacterium]|nr:type II toxin-antitoxin system RatA family toxin [Gammaproteobacteria bacterium]
MRTVNKSALVPYPAESMYDLVNDVARYPEFLPWCHSARVLSQSDTEMHAWLELARGGFHKAFTTLNTMQPGRSIAISLENGPFRHLQGYWQFEKLDSAGSKITLKMEFEFAGTLLDLMAGPVFHEICNSLVSAFMRRATDLYGKQ